MFGVPILWQFLGVVLNMGQHTFRSFDDSRERALARDFSISICTFSTNAPAKYETSKNDVPGRTHSVQRTTKKSMQVQSRLHA
jgi:hypothetical protein